MIRLASESSLAAKRSAADLLTIKRIGIDSFGERVALHGMHREDGVQVFRLAELPLIREMFQLEPSFPLLWSIPIRKVDDMSSVQSHFAAFEPRLFAWIVQCTEHPLEVCFRLWYWSLAVPADMNVQSQHIHEQLGVETGRGVCFPGSLRNVSGYNVERS